MDQDKYEVQFDAPVQGAVIGDYNTVTIYQGSKEFENQQDTQDTHSPVWNVPYRRNRFFTGREDLLNQLHDRLKANGTAARVHSQAITGLGGIGKTQIAVEYAYYYHKEYQDVLWVRAASLDTLIADFVELAALLRLPEKNEQDQNVTVMAVKQWFAMNDTWLLIMDNADDLNVAHDFLPFFERSNGHVLLTTCAFATGRIATNISVEKMTQEEGMLLLLRRANVIAADVSLDQAKEGDWDNARAICAELDGLPLAIDQAGAYIEETASSLSDYLDLYRTQRIALLKERGSFYLDHPESVYMTFLLAFEQVQASSPPASELLQLCAFLNPDAIPEEIFINNVSTLDPELQPVVANQIELKTTIKLLLNFSLVRRNPDTKTLTIHRLVQAVIKDEMDQQIQHQWAERAVRSVSRSFPFANPETWETCQRFLSHAYVCERLIEQWQVERIEAAGLLYRMGRYLQDRARYEEVELLYQKALAICEKVEGSEALGVSNIASYLAQLYQEQGKYTLAEQFYERALNILKTVLGLEHSRVASSLNGIAGLYRNQGKYTLAEQFYTQALKIQVKALGTKHHEVGAILNDLALLYQTQGKYATAEEFYKQSLQIKEQEPEDVSLSSNLSNLANIYNIQGRYAEAEQYSQQALAICKRIQGPEHPDVATRSNNLAAIYNNEGKYAEAEALYLRALDINEQVLGSDHPLVANTLNNLAMCYHAQGKHDLVESLLNRALDINERKFGPGHPSVALTLSNLALHYHDQHKYPQAEQLYKQSIATWEQTSGLEFPNYIIALKNYVTLLREMKQETKAKEVNIHVLALEKKNSQENQKLSVEDRMLKHSLKIKPDDRRSSKGKRHGRGKV